LLTERKKQEYEENGPKGKFCTLLDKKIKKTFFDEQFFTASSLWNSEPFF